MGGLKMESTNSMEIENKVNCSTSIDLWPSKLHPTMKPVRLIEKALENSSKPKDIVYEAFSGSGSMTIA